MTGATPRTNYALLLDRRIDQTVMGVTQDNAHLPEGAQPITTEALKKWLGRPCRHVRRCEQLANKRGVVRVSPPLTIASVRMPWD